jgi:hypothetical protein
MPNKREPRTSLLFRKHGDNFEQPSEVIRMWSVWKPNASQSFIAPERIFQSDKETA